MPRYRVRPGYRHGRRKEYGPGDIVELTEREATGFLDKLEYAGEEQALRVDDMQRLNVPNPSQPVSIDTEPTPEPEPEAAGPPPVNVGSMTVDEVLAAVDRGDISAADALEDERAGKSRITLIDELQERTQEGA